MPQTVGVVFGLVCLQPFFSSKGHLDARAQTSV